ncbi:hypothetical protein B0H16DRAFT_65816 [Mycena metata]|uniref:Uncharacterized protein n=1 Tax=Mycena metata TaxID=1033252 RepID=A0AAD7IB63_9AGAR|nr:hypothetical protein B0H16DRAFT_65816 [Mycena metata]
MRRSVSNGSLSKRILQGSVARKYARVACALGLRNLLVIYSAVFLSGGGCCVQFRSTRPAINFVTRALHRSRSAGARIPKAHAQAFITSSGRPAALTVKKWVTARRPNVVLCGEEDRTNDVLYLKFAPLRRPFWCGVSTPRGPGVRSVSKMISLKPRPLCQRGIVRKHVENSPCSARSRTSCVSTMTASATAFSSRETTLFAICNDACRSSLSSP